MSVLFSFNQACLYITCDMIYVIHGNKITVIVIVIVIAIVIVIVIVIKDLHIVSGPLRQSKRSHQMQPRGYPWAMICQI